MNQTKTESSSQLSGAFFDLVLAPLANSAAVFPVAPDPALVSYFGAAGVTRMTAADFEFPGGGTPEGLVEALAVWWRTVGDTQLAAAAPQLRAIADALREEAVQDDGSVDIFCYTLF